MDQISSDERSTSSPAFPPSAASTRKLIAKTIFFNTSGQDDVYFMYCIIYEHLCSILCILNDDFLYIVFAASYYLET